jgi:hypothetical protein
MSGYNVVFKGNAKAGGYEGIITWSTFKDKDEFEARKGSWPDSQDVIADGVTSEEAVKLVKTTSPKARLLAALEEATEADGSVNLRKLSLKLQMAMLIMHTDAQD